MCFERVCMAHVNQIKAALGIDRISTQFYSWRSKNSLPKAQIDMVLERADGIINLCEIKYSEAEYSLDNAESIKLRNRTEAFRQETATKAALWPTLVTTYGLHKGVHSSTFVETITLDDLFK